MIYDTFDYCKYKQDSIIEERHKKIGVKKNISKIYFNELNKIIIHPNEKLFFKVNLDLPNNYCQLPEIILFEKNKKYTFKLNFKIDSTNINNKLLESTLKIIKENNYELFHGNIISNEIPIEFIDNQ